MIQKRGVEEGRSVHCPSHLAHHPQQQQLPHPHVHPYIYTAVPSISNFKIPPKVGTNDQEGTSDTWGLSLLVVVAFETWTWGRGRVEGVGWIGDGVFAGVIQLLGEALQAKGKLRSLVPCRHIHCLLKGNILYNSNWFVAHVTLWHTWRNFHFVTWLLRVWQGPDFVRCSDWGWIF